MNLKRKLSGMLIVILVLQIMLPMLTVIIENGFTITSKANEEIKSGEWTYTVNDDGSTITIIEYRGKESKIIIPSEIDKYTVTGLGNGRVVDSSQDFSVFRYGNRIDTIKLPSTLVTIGTIAFSGCCNLRQIELNEGLQTIGNKAFSECEKLESINIPSTVSNIVNYYELSSFYGCSSLKSINVAQNNQYYSSSEGILFNKDKSTLISYPTAKEETTYSIPETVKEIYGQSITNLNLTDLYISKNVVNMEGDEYFAKYTNIFSIQDCVNLKNITVDEENTKFSSKDGVLFNKDKSSLLLYPSGKQDNYYEIPDTVNSCATINNPYIETIKLNNILLDTEFLVDIKNLKNIEVDNQNANFMQQNGILFNKSGNKIVYYPAGRDEETYTIDRAVTQIEDKAFINAKLTEIILPENLIAIGSYSFYNCQNLETINLPENIIKISDYSFYNCNKLDNIIIPSNVTEIGDCSFYNCTKLSSITIPSKVIEIGTKAFYNCINMEKLIFEENSQIEQLGIEAFSNCSKLEEVNIPEGITDYDCFIGCDRLRIINLPSTVTDITGYSFNSLYTRPQIITINNENPTIFQRMGIY